MLVVGCYSLQPALGVTPEAGVSVAIDINDAGRAALGGSMGPEISQIEGVLVDRDATQYVLSVTAVRLLRGGEQTWTGERIPIKNEYVSSVYRRRFSPVKTAVFSALGAGLVAIVASKGLSGSVGRDVPPILGDTAATNRRPLRVMRGVNLMGVFHATRF